ncbi:hypothetical protein VNO77_43870 [Canavalia gladiata]|uniref:Uncharacterized protein n=1 Tax=Canavalia gladiata TaxID=3824 RepID=A0AAN9PQ87_CANGL
MAYMVSVIKVKVWGNKGMSLLMGLRERGTSSPGFMVVAGNEKKNHAIHDSGSNGGRMWLFKMVTREDFSSSCFGVKEIQMRVEDKKTTRLANGIDESSEMGDGGNSYE